MRKMKFLMSSISLLLIMSCSVKEGEYTSYTYNKLPNDVRERFQNIYDYIPYEPFKLDNGKIINGYTPPGMQCYDMDKKCPCKIKSGGDYIDFYFEITTCDGKTIKIPGEIYQRVFIIKKDSIYYPIGGSSIQSGKPLSADIKIDTVMFHSQKIK